MYTRRERAAHHAVHRHRRCVPAFGGCKATWKRNFKIPWHEAGPPNHHDDTVDSDQKDINKELSFSAFGSRDLVLLALQVRHLSHGGVRPFHQKSACLTQLTLGLYAVRIWSRNTPESGPNKTFVRHHVDRSSAYILVAVRVSDSAYQLVYRGTSPIRNRHPP